MYAWLLLIVLGGDSIGPDSALTDNTGGFTAVQDGAINYGQPAIGVTVPGGYDLDEYRAVVFGSPGDWRLTYWPLNDYLNGGVGQQFDLADLPLGAPFGNTGPAGDWKTTYDLHFDITALELPGSGEYVFGFQSFHDWDALGPLRVTGSNVISIYAPTPYMSRDHVPRGLLGGTGHIAWGMSISAKPNGDYNEDGLVNVNDYVTWRDANGSQEEYNAWRANFVSNSEPSSMVVWCILIVIAFLFRKHLPLGCKHDVV